MRIRTVKPEFWANEKMSAMPDFTRLVALALLNYADDHGYFWANCLMIRGALFPFEEDSTRLRRAVEQLAAIGYLKLGKSPDGRECGVVVNFKKHQRVDKPQDSQIQHLVTLQESSQKNLGLFQDESQPDRKGSEGIGSIARAPSGAEQREAQRSLPESLNTAPFKAAWEKWIVHFSASFARGGSIPMATADNHLELLRRLGPVRGVEAIENAITRMLREPALPNGPSNKQSQARPRDAASIEREKLF